jgi:hypothetical protein
MLTVLIVALTYAGVRGVIAVARSWQDLPHSNEDMVYF